MHLTNVQEPPYKRPDTQYYDEERQKFYEFQRRIGTF